jgi:aspartyl-tRNA(Asn)/glutamyl-tRNA(Gln) amidotransferase subunit A
VTEEEMLAQARALDIPVEPERIPSLTREVDGLRTRARALWGVVTPADEAVDFGAWLRRRPRQERPEAGGTPSTAQREVLDPADLSLAEASNLIRQGNLSPVMLAEAVTSRMNRLDKEVNSFTYDNQADLRDAAQTAEAEIASGGWRGPLHGIPLSLKDLFDVTGLETSGSSRIVRYQAGADSAVWAGLKEAGALLVGKTNMHELAFGATTVNPHTGATRNPWDLARVPGGSSGGAAAATAAGMGLGSLGSDTGGSIRCPAALCGLTGLKPTYGLVSRKGVLPLSWSCDHVGPIARTAEDCRLILEVIAGAPVSRPAVSLKGLRVGVLQSQREAVREEEVGALFDAAVGELERQGALVQTLDLPEEGLANDIGTLILYAEAFAVHGQMLRQTPELFGPDVRGRLQTAAFVSAGKYIDAQRARPKVTAQILDRMSAFDVVVSPTVPVSAPTIELTAPIADGALDPRMVLLRNTRLADVTGQPAISVPCGFTSTGLPVGLQIMGQPHEDGFVLAVAEAYQTITDWHLRRPALH